MPSGPGKIVECFDRQLEQRWPGTGTKPGIGANLSLSAFKLADHAGTRTFDYVSLVMAVRNRGRAPSYGEDDETASLGSRGRRRRLWGKVLAIPGCAMQGATCEELPRNLYEAVRVASV